MYAKKLLQTMAAEEVWRMSISIDTNNLQQFIEYLVYEVNQATSISARLAEQETKFMTTDRALRGVKTGVELLVQITQETISGGQRQSTDTQVLRDRWDAIAAGQTELKMALNTIGVHIKYLQKSGSSKDSRSECDRLNIRVQMSATALQDLSALIKPALISASHIREHEDMAFSDVASVSPSEGYKKTSKFGDLGTKAFTKPERHVSRQSISEQTGLKDGDDFQIFSDLQGHKWGSKLSHVFRKEDKHKQDNGPAIEVPPSENEKHKGLGMNWRHSLQAMKGNKSRSDIFSVQEKTPYGEKKPPQDNTPKIISLRPDSPQELPVRERHALKDKEFLELICLQGRTSFEESSTPIPPISPPPIYARPPLVSPGSSTHFNFPSLENLRKLGGDGDISEFDFDLRKEVLGNIDGWAGSRASSPKPSLRDKP